MTEKEKVFINISAEYEKHKEAINSNILIFNSLNYMKGTYKMTEKEKVFINISAEYEKHKEAIKELKIKMLELMKDIGIEKHFQDEETGLVYKIIKPAGTYISFDEISYVRTKKETELKGSLSKKEAESFGYTIK